MVISHRKHRMKCSLRLSVCSCHALSSHIALIPSGKYCKNSTPRRLSICKDRNKEGKEWKILNISWCFGLVLKPFLFYVWLNKREIINAINRYMRDKKVNSSLQRRIGAYIEYQYKRQRSRDESLEQGIIMKLAPNLREELIYEAHASLFDSIPWMKYFSAEFIKSLAFSIEEYNYSEKEIIYQVGRW